LFHFEFGHIQATGFLDVDAVDAHECGGGGLAAVGGYGIAHGLGDDFHAHARFDADAVAVFHMFGCDSESCHVFKVLRCVLSSFRGKIRKNARMEKL